MIGWETPPAIYDHAPDGPYYIEHRTLVDVNQMCKALGVEGLFVWGCAIPAKTGCYVIIPLLGKGGVGTWQYLRIRRHELAHCNGWRH